MSTKLKRITFAVDLDMEPVLDRAKRIFYDCTQSEMIRLLLVKGLDAYEEESSKQG